MVRWISYYRVSTLRQGHSGLGLDAQRTDVAAYVARQGGELLAELTEIESGRKDDRPELTKALALCKRHKATLVIAKLDRLARSVAFISSLMESGVKFVAVDMPEAGRFSVHILAAVAEHEREAISARTKAALVATKARGTRLGNPRPDMPRLHALAADRAARFRAEMRPVVAPIRASLGERGTLRAVAAELNARHVPALNGGVWHAGTVRRVLAEG